jgi:hypothetical protein
MHSVRKTEIFYQNSKEEAAKVLLVPHPAEVGFHSRSADMYLFSNLSKRFPTVLHQGIDYGQIYFGELLQDGFGCSFWLIIRYVKQ